MSDPVIQTSNSAGADLTSAEDVIIPAGESRVVSTGYLYHVGWPEAVGLVRGRSGLAFSKRVIAYEGTIDSDYCGKEVKVLLFNLGSSPFEVKTGDRIAQIVICRQVTERFFRKKEEKRVGGFGSTGEG